MSDAKEAYTIGIDEAGRGPGKRWKPAVIQVVQFLPDSSPWSHGVWDVLLPDQQEGSPEEVGFRR